MTCEQYRLLLHDLLDGLLPEQTVRTMAAHEAECPECAAYRADMHALMQTLHTLDDDLEPPASFGQAWRRAIRLEAANRRRSPARQWRTWTAIAATLLCLVGGTSLMRAGVLPGLMAREETQLAMENEADYDDSLPYLENGGFFAKFDGAPDMGTGSLGGSAAMGRSSPDALDVQDSAADDTDPNAPPSREGVKILRSGYFHVASAHFDDDLQSLLALTESSGGWVEYQSISGEPLSQNPEGGRYGSLTLRIPADTLDQFVSELSGIGRLQNSELSAQDISDRYRDEAIRLTQYEAQRERLTALMDSAESVADIIEIEQRLAEVQYQIDTLTGMLKGWDSRAQFAQITISLTETAERAQILAENPSIGTRIREGFARSWEFISAFMKDMAVFLVVAAPWLLAIAAIAVGVTLILRRVRRRHNPYEEE